MRESYGPLRDPPASGPYGAQLALLHEEQQKACHSSVVEKLRKVMKHLVVVRRKTIRG